MFPGAGDFADSEPRCPCILLLDTSQSMAGASIDELNRGVSAFVADLLQDDLARRRVDIAIISFGKLGVQLVQDFVTADQMQTPTLEAGDLTPMGKALGMGLDMLRQRKNSYNGQGIPYYRPWMFLITDGEPNDDWQGVVGRLHDEIQKKALTFFAVGVQNANMQILSQIATVERPAARLDGLRFVDLFLWLSNSLGRVSRSKPEEQVALAKPGWMEV